MLDHIFIKGLALEAVIGVYHHEQLNKQPVIVDLDLFIDAALAAKSAQLSDTIDYDSVAQRVSDFVSMSQCQLIETLAQQIAELILIEFKVMKVRCTLYKPLALKNAQQVGITVEREKFN